MLLISLESPMNFELNVCTQIDKIESMQCVIFCKAQNATSSTFIFCKKYCCEIQFASFAIILWKLLHKMQDIISDLALHIFIANGKLNNRMKLISVGHK